MKARIAEIAAEGEVGRKRRTVHRTGRHDRKRWRMKTGE